MSHFTHPHISSPIHLSRRTAWLAALLTLAAAAAVVLVIAIGNDASQDAAPAAVQAQPSLRSGGGPEETGVAASVGSHVSAGPSESATAGAIGRGSSPYGATSSASSGGPDEASTAASISGR